MGVLENHCSSQLLRCMIHTQLTQAMAQEKFNLQWREFNQSAEQTIKDLFSDDYFTDVTLVSHDEKQIQAHKVILCGASPFFRRILMKNPHQNPLLFLKGVQMRTLRSLVNFIYLGQAEVEQDQLEMFLAAAKDLEIKGLSQEDKVINGTPEQTSESKREDEVFNARDYVISYDDANEVFNMSSYVVKD